MPWKRPGQIMPPPPRRCCEATSVPCAAQSPLRPRANFSQPPPKLHRFPPPWALQYSVLPCALRALAAPVHPAPLANTVLHAAVRAPARALAAPGPPAPLPAAVRHAEVRAAVDALGAHDAAALVHAPLPAAVCLCGSH